MGITAHRCAADTTSCPPRWPGLSRVMEVAGRLLRRDRFPPPRRSLIAFTLPDLPYSLDALAPFMSKTTLKFHHAKRDQAYVPNANNALKGNEGDEKPL